MSKKKRKKESGVVLLSLSAARRLVAERRPDLLNEFDAMSQTVGNAPGAKPAENKQ